MIDFEDIEIGDLMYHKSDGVNNTNILARIINKRIIDGNTKNLTVKVLDFQTNKQDFFSFNYIKGYEFNYDYDSKFGQHFVYGKDKDELLIEMI